MCEWQAGHTEQTSCPFSPEVSRLRGSHTRRADLGAETGLQADAAAGETGGLGRPVTDLLQRREQGGRAGVSER